VRVGVFQLLRYSVLGGITPALIILSSFFKFLNGCLFFRFYGGCGIGLCGGVYYNKHHIKKGFTDSVFGFLFL